MSSALATARPSSLPGTPSPAVAPAPRIVEIAPDRAQRRARPKAAYAVVIVASLGVLMLSQLALSIALSDGAYQIDALQTTQKEQSRTVQDLSEDLGRLSSPQNLAGNAEALGMVQNSNPVWLRMSDGSVVGAPTAAAGGEGVMGAAGSQVANELLAGVPLVTQLPADQAQAAANAAAAAMAASTAAGVPAAAAPAAETSPVSGAAAGSASGAQVVSDSRIPAPTTR